MALGVVLHTPDLWSVSEAGLNGLYVGLGIYVAVQIIRSLWWLRKPGSRSGAGR